ncbi:hypothetical protein GHT06_010636 [Daphnia sinensis]|uniref:Uncharacterized protein n=1 Tax=Daphnia sinensis TaxID=1820382 RepID=A0AAD5LSI4_9CRUS|nr:hypothetical protein GHT06_010636 [Daphnia sinensis]
MDDDSLNGGDTKSSALSMEEEEELEEDGVSLTTTSSSAAASPPPPQPPTLAHPLPSHRGRPPSRPPSEEADQLSVKSSVAKPQIAPTPPPPPPPPQPQTATANMAAAVKRRREMEQDELIIVPSASRPSPPAQLTVPGLPTQHPLLSADLLHSLQYFALLRQSIPNGSLMNLPVAPPPPPPPPPPIPNRLSPTPPASSKSSAGLNHMCPSCGICFSSASTLSAHATYYCSKRPQVSPAAAAPVTSASPLPTLPTQPEMMANVAALSNGRSQTPEPMDELLNDRPSAPKIRRSGRYYACPYCSFSADKRVSLNRHMRVHVGLPLLATHPVSPPPLPVGHLETSRSLSSDRPTAGSSPEFRAMNKLQEEPAHRSDAGADRFCSDCKIQFSSFKTFQVHKQHYCQSRKMAGANLPAGSPVPSLEKSIPAAETLAGRAQNAGGGPMTILMLPTHPPIVIPLCILQSARLLTADQPMPPHSVIVSPHGDIQFRADSPEEPRSTASSAVVTPAASTTPAAVASVPAMTVAPSAPVSPVPPATSAQPAEPPLTANATTVPPETALDLSSKTSDSDPAAMESFKKEPVTKESVANSNATGGIRIREELAHVNQSSPDNPSQQQPQQQPALPFLPPKVFAELEALGMCLGVPSGHDMTSNPAQWLAMLENAVLQASFKAPATVPVVPPSSNKTDLIHQAQRPSSAILAKSVTSASGGWKATWSTSSTIALLGISSRASRPAKVKRRLQLPNRSTAISRKNRQQFPPSIAIRSFNGPINTRVRCAESNSNRPLSCRLIAAFIAPRGKSIRRLKMPRMLGKLMPNLWPSLPTHPVRLPDTMEAQRQVGQDRFSHKDGSARVATSSARRPPPPRST